LNRQPEAMGHRGVREAAFLVEADGTAVGNGAQRRAGLSLRQGTSIVDEAPAHARALTVDTNLEHAQVETRCVSVWFMVDDPLCVADDLTITFCNPAVEGPEQAMIDVDGALHRVYPGTIGVPVDVADRRHITQCYLANKHRTLRSASADFRNGFCDMYPPNWLPATIGGLMTLLRQRGSDQGDSVVDDIGALRIDAALQHGHCQRIETQTRPDLAGQIQTGQPEDVLTEPCPL